ncbi:MAG: YggS family pyridoxal phosphate-dependent enzyme [Clostridia bacterium]
MERSFVEQRFTDIEENLKEIRENIAQAAMQSGRTASDIHLMAVTKTVEPIFINHAIDLGIDLIGENKVQELEGKREHLHLDHCEVHLIGHLQTNKVKKIVGQVSMIQSVDSLKLAQEIGRQSVLRDLTTEILLEVNIGREESKTGFMPESLEESLYEIGQIDGVHISGLMAIPPICENEFEVRKFFSNMHQLFVDISAKKLDNMSMRILSMGMSGDYQPAILEGANLVRIGSSIFGARRY